MKNVLIGLIVLMATSAAVADTDHNIRVNRIEMTEAASDDTTTTKATDHNSSRSNKTSHTPAAASDADDSDANDSSSTEATDYNSSRSNKADSIAADDDAGEVEAAKKSKD